MTKSLSMGLVAVFFALYGWDVWEALGNLLGLPAFYEALGVGESVPWVLLWGGLVMPVVVFVAATVVAYRLDSLLERFLVFVTGWALVAALSVSLSEIEQGWRATALMSVLG
jgi:hypothetical protein